MSQTYYEILGVDSKASEKEIKSAFRKLARKHHPDVKGDPAKFREIYAAYETLVDADKRAKYDRLGHEQFERSGSGKEREVRYPSYEEIFRELYRMSSTQTPYEHFVGGAYPAFYTGGIVEDPFTGDEYSSAEDIRIAKADRTYAIFRTQIDNIANSIYRDLWEPERLRRLSAVLFNTHYISDTEYEEAMRLIEEYEIKEKEYQSEKNRSEHAEELGDPVQERIEKNDNKERRETQEAKSNSKIDRKFVRAKKRGLAAGGDTDERSKWRKEAGEGRKLR